MGPTFRMTLTSSLILVHLAWSACAQVLLYSVPSTFAPFAIVLGDVNGNGTVDHFHMSQVSPGFYGVDIREGGSGDLILQIPLGSNPPGLIERAGDIDLDGGCDVLFLSGAPSTPLIVYSSNSGVVLLTIPSPAPANFLSAFGCGDANLDGWPDLLAEVAGGGIPPQLQIRSGLDGALLQVLPWGNASPAGDVDGDGRADILVASTVWNAPATFGIHSGATGALIRTVVLPLTASGAFPSFRVTDVGDFDGDGIPDACVSTFEPLNTSIGMVYVYSLVTGAIIHSFSGPSGNQAGIAKFLGDLSGDGVSEFLFLTTFTPYVMDGVTASTRPLINYPNGCTYIDLPVIGDVTHDGIGDIIVYHCQFGAPWQGYDVVSPVPLQPAEQRLLGSGCGPTLTLSAPPVIGTVPTLSVTGASPGMTGFLWAGPRTLNPVPLGNLCSLHLDLPLSSEVAVFSADPGGSWTTLLPIPATTALIDVRLTLQAALVTPGVAVTNALYLRLGY